jgi:hypothetical protein
MDAVAVLLQIHRAPAPASSGDLMPTLITPDAIRQRIEAINAQVDLLNQEIGASADQTLKLRFMSWFLDWKAWRQRVSGDSWLLFWSGKAVDEELTQWQKNLQGWREQFEKRGGQPVSPTPPGPPPSTQPTVIGPALEGIGNIVLGVALIGGAIVLVKAFK